MKREYIKKANELDNEILNIENLIEIWEKSESFESFDGKIHIIEPGIGVRLYEINIEDVPFEKIKQMFLEHYESQKQIKEEKLQRLLMDHYENLEGLSKKLTPIKFFYKNFKSIL